METAFAVDAQGKVWLFGGNGFGSGGSSGFLNDLWEFTPGPAGSVGTWKMMSGGNAVNNAGIYGTQGSPSTSNVPSGRSDAVCWFDSNGNFWLFGGLGFSSAVVGGGGPFLLNDLWEYSPSANTWTWVSGPNFAAGVPVGRAGANYWSDGKGNVWMFGGVGFDAPRATVPGPLNDLWFFNSTTGQWKLINGSVTVAGSVGNYGQQAVPSPNNVPPGRSLATSWVDSQGNLWLFGGNNSDVFVHGSSLVLQNLFNDLWEFKPASNTWIWIGGSQGPGSAALPGASPGARTGAAAWHGSFPNAWLFGGFGVNSSTSFTFPLFLFDLWDGTGNVY